MIKKTKTLGYLFCKHLSYYLLVNRLLSRFKNFPLILYFHRISPPTNSLLDRIGNLELEEFKKIINHLSFIGYRFVNLEDIVSTLGSKSSERLAVITFDDGFSDMYVSAYPFLKEKGIRFTLFLITSTLESDSLLWLHKLYILLDKLAETEKIEFLKDFVGDNCSNDSVSSMLDFIIHHTDKETVNRILTKLTSRIEMTQDQEKEYARQLYLNRTQLLEMAENGLQIHSHGHEHWPMNILSKAELTQEVHQSKEVIEEVFSCNPRFFCFPYGSENKNLTPILQDAAFMGNCCLGNRPVRPDDKPFYLPRVQHCKDAKTFAWQLLKLHLKRKF